MSFDLDDEEPATLEPNDWLRRALSNARERRKVRYVEEKKKGCNWLLECRDMWDTHDAAAGVYFEGYKTSVEVDKKVKKNGGDQKVMGIYDLNMPLNEQESGITAVDWENNSSKQIS